MDFDLGSRVRLRELQAYPDREIPAGTWGTVTHVPTPGSNHHGVVFDDEYIVRPVPTWNLQGNPTLQGDPTTDNPPPAPPPPPPPG